MNQALFIGRFQPLHTGHIAALKQIQEDEVIIAIGSSQYQKTKENPFSFEERKHMITEALHEHAYPKHYSIVAIPDIHNPQKWVAHVESHIGNEYVVYTGNPLTKQLFEEKGYTVHPVHCDIPISATHIRTLLAHNKSGWKSYIPKSNHSMLINYYGA